MKRCFTLTFTSFCSSNKATTAFGAEERCCRPHEVAARAQPRHVTWRQLRLSAAETQRLTRRRRGRRRGAFAATAAAVSRITTVIVASKIVIVPIGMKALGVALTLPYCRSGCLGILRLLLLLLKVRLQSKARDMTPTKKLVCACCSSTALKKLRVTASPQVVSLMPGSQPSNQP